MASSVIERHDELLVVVPPEVFKRLKSEHSFTLLVNDHDSDTYKEVTIHPSDFRQHLQHNGRVYHVIPEIVRREEDGLTIQLCSSCNPAFNKKKIFTVLSHIDLIFFLVSIFVVSRL